VDDLADAYVRIGQKGNLLRGQLFDVATIDSPTYEELRVAMAKAAGWNGVVKFEKVPEDNPLLNDVEPTVLINPQKAVDVLGWQPRHTSFLREVEVYYHSWRASKE